MQLDNSTRKKIRKAATRRFRWMTVALLLAFVLIIVAQTAQRRIADNYGRATLARESAALTREFMRFEAGRGQELVVLPPPIDTATTRREIWARRIGDELEQPAAVCIIRNSTVAWITKPHEFAATADSISRGLDSSHAGSRMMFGSRTLTMEKFGTTQSFLVHYDAGEDIHDLWLFSRAEDSLKWGVLLGSNDTWLSFFGRIHQTAAVDPEVGSPAWALQDMFALPKSTTQRWNMGLRAFLNDSLIYSSADLDTTRPSYVYNFNGRRAECYLSRWQEISTHWIMMRWAFWPILLLPLALIAAFYTDYYRIRKLTEPQSEEQSRD